MSKQPTHLILVQKFQSTAQEQLDISTCQEQRVAANSQHGSSFVGEAAIEGGAMFLARGSSIADIAETICEAEIIASVGAETACAVAAETICETATEGVFSAIGEFIGNAAGEIIGGIFDGL